MMIRHTRRIQQWTMVDLTTDLSFLFGDPAQVVFLNREHVFFHIGFLVGIIHSSKVFLCKWLSFISAAVSNCFMQMCFVFSSSWHSSLAGVRSRISGSGSQKRGSSTTRPTLSRSKTNLPTRSSIIRIDNFPWTLSLNLFFFL